MAKQWNNEAEEILKECYKDKGAQYCADVTGKTVHAIRKHAQTLGLSSKHAKANYERDKLQEAVANSRSFSDTLLKLGLKVAGGSLRTVQDKIKALSIDTSHFPAHIDGSDKLLTAYEDVFCVTSKASRKTVKVWFKRLGRKFVCELDGCGQPEVWRGKKMSLILDHINGIKNDNTYTNLRLVCPNCNATLDTHCGKNMKRKAVKQPKLRGLLTQENSL